MEILGLILVDIAKPEFEIYPNPSQGIFNIYGYSPSKEDRTLKIKNVEGQIVFEKAIPNANNSFSVPVDLSNHKGVFTIELIGQTETQVKRMVIN